MKSTDCFASHIKKNQWFSFPKENSEADLRLFCLPYAGGSSHVYYPWQDKLSSDIEICAIQLPGRGIRFTETPYTDHKKMVIDLVDDMVEYLDKPYALFGHSMGALLAYEVAQEIKKRGLPQASHLFVSGRRAMHINNESQPIHDLPEEQLISELKKLNGTPAEVLENKDLMSLVLPMIRADFQLCETYLHNVEHKKLDLNITSFEGVNDHKARGINVSAWQDLTSGIYQGIQLSGDHFFIHSSEQKLLENINHHLNDYLKDKDQLLAM